MKYALLTLMLAQAGLASAPGDGAPRRRSSFEVGRDRDRGFREAEHVLGALTDIRSTRSRYLRRVAAEARSVWEQTTSVDCHETNPCSYLRYFDISAGARTKVALLFELRLSPSAKTLCGDPRPDQSCALTAAVIIAGDEAFPHCVGVEPIRRAAIRNGWSPYPFRYPYDDNVSRYRHEGVEEMYLFIRTMNGDRCFRSIYIARLPGIRIRTPAVR